MFPCVSAILKAGPVFVWFGQVAEGGSSLRILGVASVGCGCQSFSEIVSSFIALENPFSSDCKENNKVFCASNHI